VSEDRYIYIALVLSGTEPTYQQSQPFTGKQTAIDWVARICHGCDNPYWGEVYKHAFHPLDRTISELVYEHK